MINTKHLHWLIKERANRGASNVYQDFTPIELDQLIDDAARIVLNRSVPAEGNSFDTTLVAPILVTYPDQPTITPVAVGPGKYEVKTTDLKYDYFRYKRIFVDQGCGNVKVTMEGVGRLNDILEDEFQKPSKDWRRVYGYVAKSSTDSTGSIYLLCEPGTIINDVYIDYVRYPKKVFFGGYDSVEYLDCVERGGANCTDYYSQSSPIQDLELDELYQSLIVDTAVTEMMRIMESNGFNLKAEKLTRIN